MCVTPLHHISMLQTSTCFINPQENVSRFKRNRIHMDEATLLLHFTLYLSNLVSREMMINDFTSSGEVIFVDIPLDPGPLVLNAFVGSSVPMSFSSGVNLFRNLRAFCTTSCLAATERERMFSFDSCECA
jgi:hypothetical protein